MNALQVRCIMMMSEEGIIDEFFAILDSFTDEEFARLSIMSASAMLP